MKSGRGVVSYISNHSFVSEPSFVVLRKSLLKSFDKLWIENLHGNRKISEYAPDGRTSETIFAVSGFSPGIRQGVVTSLWVKSGEAKRKVVDVRFRDDINAAKADERRQQLLLSLKTEHFDAPYVLAEPSRDNKYSFRPEMTSPEYQSWPRISELCAEPAVTGFKENRGFSLISDDKSKLSARMKKYFDREVVWAELGLLNTGLTKDVARFDAKKTRNRVTEAETFDTKRLQRYLLRPFDSKWCYYSAVRPLWNEPRPSLYRHCFDGNAFVVSRPAGVASPEGVPIYYATVLGDFDFIRGHSYHFPVRLREVYSPAQKTSKKAAHRSTGVLSLDDRDVIKSRPNLSVKASEYIASILGNAADTKMNGTALWYHVLAIGFAPLYLRENADGIRGNWPRIPLTKSKPQFIVSAELGEKIAKFLDTERSIPEISGSSRVELAMMAVPTRIDGKPLDPHRDDFDVTAGWGHGGKDGITMPGRGRVVERGYSKEEMEAFSKGARELCLTLDQMLAVLGKETRDIYLNDVAYWKNVPVNVWEYYIGGYQVIKKWLSYREKSLLGRALKLEEVEYVQEMVRRIATIVLLQPALDDNYRKIKSNTYSWPKESVTSARD